MSIINKLELTQILELAKNDLKTVVMPEFHLFIKLSRAVESIKEKNINFLVESTISEMKYVSDRISGRLDSEEEILITLKAH